MGLTNHSLATWDQDLVVTSDTILDEAGDTYDVVNIRIEIDGWWDRADRLRLSAAQADVLIRALQDAIVEIEAKP